MRFRRVPSSTSTGRSGHRATHRCLTLAAAALLIGGLGACRGAPSSSQAADDSSSTAAAPVSVTSCGFTTTVDKPPTRLVTLNQGATEVALALDLQSSMVGTAYLDDSVAAKWEAAYKSVPVISKEYPSKEKLLATNPDFVYASYSSAFSDKVAGTQAELKGEGIDSYLSPFGCSDPEQVPPVTWKSVWGEIDDVARVFGVSSRAEALTSQQQDELDQVGDTDAGKGLDVLWYDSGKKTPFVGAGHGGPQLILDAVGAHNVFGNLSGGWKSVSWEKVVAADPDAIVLADASWDSAQSKIDYLEKDPVLSKLKAVQDHDFVIVPFSESTPGVRLADGAVKVSAGLQKLQPGS